MMSNSSSISHNIVGQSGRQNNISTQIENQNFSGNFRDLNIYFLFQTFGRVHPSEYISRQGVQQYLYSVARDVQRQIVSPPRVSNPRHCFVKHFQATSPFEDHLNLCIRRYPDRKTHKSIMSILDSNSVQKLSDWKNTNRSSSLLLHLYGEVKERADWTTHFTLEMIGCIAQSDHAIGKWQTSAVLAHFCVWQYDPARWTQEGLIRDFLFQIRRARLPELKATHKCETPGQADDIFHNPAEGPAQLWTLLRCAVARAGIKSLYVFIDNLDYIHDRAHIAVLRDFYTRLHGFLGDCQKIKITVKLVITSRSPDIARHIPISHQIALAQSPLERLK